MKKHGMIVIVGIASLIFPFLRERKVGAVHQNPDHYSSEVAPVLLGPLEVIPDAVGLPSKVRFHLSNVSQYTVAVVVIKFSQVVGEEELGHWISVRGKLVPTYSDDSLLLPGQVWSIENAVVNYPDTPDADVRAEIDLVIFNDGASWGPDSRRQRRTLAGMHRGAMLERTRLRELLILQGTEALIEEVLRLEGATPFFHAQPDVRYAPDLIHDSVRRYVKQQ